MMRLSQWLYLPKPHFQINSVAGLRGQNVEALQMTGKDAQRHLPG